jgi:GABA permease
MHNPLRSEADVFRLVVAIVAGAALVVALTLLTRPVWGVLLAALLIGIGIGLAWRMTRGSEPRSVVARRTDDDTRRILVVANQTAAGRELLEEISNRCRGLKCEVMLVSPALVGSRAERWASDIDAGLDLARERMDRSVTALRGIGIEVRAEVGDPDPNMAIEDALRVFPADEIVISTLPPEQSRWLEHEVVERTRREVELPMTHVIVDLDAERATAQLRSVG